MAFTGSLHWVDLTILGVYCALILIVCIKVTSRSPNADELFLAGRSLGAGVVGLSLFASNISSTTLIGLPGAAWEFGISVANYEWMAGLALVFSALFIAPVFIRQNLTTVPEILDQRFDARTRKYLSGSTLFLSIALDTAGSLYAGALVLMLFFPSLELTQTIVVIALFAGLYTTAGGLRAVAYTDVLQSIVLLVGSCILTVIVFGEFDYSWAAVKATVEPDKLSLIRPMDDPALPWLGTLIGLPVLGFYYWTMNQYVAQRLLGARDAQAAAQGALIAATLKLLPLFIMVLPGVMAVSLFGDLERADTVFPRLIAEYAPPGLAGLMLAGLMAAIMSSVDSTLNSSSTLIMVDFVKPKRPNMTTEQLAKWGRFTTLLLMIIAAAWAPAIDSFPGIFAYLQQTFAFVTPPLVAMFAVAFISKTVGAKAAFFGTLIGHIISLLCFIAQQVGAITLHFTVVAGLLFLATLAIILALQYLTGWAPATTQQASTTQLTVSALKDANMSASPGVKRAALALLFLTGAMVVAFW